jgi:hypothetical protein
MERFIQHYEKDIIGHLNGFDRLVLRGTLRALAVKNGMMSYLWNVGIQLKDCGKLFLDKSRQLKEASCAQAHRENRPVVYLASPKTNKEQEALKIAQRDGIRNGLICVLTAVEPCQSYEIHRNREQKKRYCQVSCVKFSSANSLKNGSLLRTLPIGLDLQWSSILSEMKARSA